MSALTPAFLGTLGALGFVGAFISGLVGVGGAVIMIPLLYYVPAWLGVGELDIKSVAGVTMAQVLAAALVGSAVHGGAVHRPLATVAGTSMAFASLVGAIASRYVGGRTLLAVFGTMAALALFLMLLPPPPADVAQSGGIPLDFDRWAAVVYPGIIGFLSGLVGAGGAFLLMPVLIGMMRIPVRRSIGTSLAIAGIAAATGFLGKLVTAQVPLWPTVAVVGGSIGGAVAGARLSRRVPEGLLRLSLAALLLLVTVRVWVDVISH